MIDESRIEYLGRGHDARLSRAGLDGLDPDELSAAIEQKVTNRRIYNLRFVLGARAGVPARVLDALMYSVQVKFPDVAGGVKRYQVGLKYTPETHTREIATFSRAGRTRTDLVSRTVVRSAQCRNEELWCRNPRDMGGRTIARIIYANRRLSLFGLREDPESINTGGLA